MDSYGLVQVGQRGSLSISNLFLNEIPGQLQIPGGASGNATGSVINLSTYGTVNVSTGGRSSRAP